MEGVSRKEFNILSHFTGLQIAEYKQLFTEFDLNKDDHITCIQLKECLTAYFKEKSREEIEEIVNEADISGHGCVTFDNFMQLILDRDLREKRNEDKQLFDSFDLNGDGFIDITELSTVFFSLNNIDETQILRIFSQLDRNNHGKVGFEEFQEFMEWCSDFNL